MVVSWALVAEPREFAWRVIHAETPSVGAVIDPEWEWQQVEVPLSRLMADEDLITRHDDEPLHCRRRDHFLGVIDSGATIPPLLASVAGAHLQLIDGYARFRALRARGIESASVVHPVLS